MEVIVSEKSVKRVKSVSVHIMYIRIRCQGSAVIAFTRPRHGSPMCNLACCSRPSLCAWPPVARCMAAIAVPLAATWATAMRKWDHACSREGKECSDVLPRGAEGNAASATCSLAAMRQHLPVAAVRMARACPPCAMRMARACPPCAMRMARACPP
eukprot:351168-Chlamydomonas_euryale.AAC.3